MASVTTRSAAAAALAALVLVGCGSTRTPGSLDARGSIVGGDQGLGDPLDPTPSPQTSGANDASSRPQVGQSQSSAPSATEDVGADALTSSDGGPAVLGASYTGVSASSINVGLSAAGSGSSVGSQISGSQGVSGYSQSPEEQIQRALVAYVNAHGGVLGRKLNPVFHYYSNSDTAPYDQQSQETCTYLTEDKKVFAHLAVVSDTTFTTCMEKHGTVGVETLEPGSRQAAAAAPGVFYPGDLNLTTLTEQSIDHFVSSGFLTKGSTIGLLESDTPDMDLVRKALASRLGTHGLSLAQTYRVTPVNSNADAALAIRDMLGAVLKFKASGIDRVLFLIDRGGATGPIQFMGDAQQQGYHPRYGLTTHDGPVALTGGNAPAAQLVGSMGFGFHPEQDVNTPARAQVSPAAASCLSIIAKAKITLADAGQRAGALKYCEAIFFFVEVAKAAGPALTRSSFIRSGETLGDAFSDPFTLKGSTLLRGLPHDGVHLWQPIAYVEQCACFRSAGPVTSL